MDSASFASRPRRLLAAAVCATLVVAACDRHDRGDRAGPGAASPAAAAASRAADEASTAKYNGYVAVHDTLAGGAGLDATRRSYDAAIADARRRSNPSFSSGWFDHAIEQLKSARGRTVAGFEELDGAADRLLATLEPLQRAMKPLGVYFDSRAYMEDKGASAIAQDASTVAAFDAASRALEGFDAALTRAGDARTARRLQALEASGDRLGYDLLKSMTQARTLMDAIEAASKASRVATTGTGSGSGKPARSSSPPRLETGAADAALADLERTLADARQEIDKRRAAQPANSTGSPLNEQESAVARLTSFGGAYRDWRADTGHEHGRMVVYAYNSAVDAFNRIPTRVYQRVSN